MDEGPGHGDAERFYTGVEHVFPVLFEPHGDVPLHPSFEGDGAFASLDDDALERHVAAWSDHLAAAGAADKDVLHLHHLTPLNEVARRIAPGVPVVAHLHGTELLMLERIAEDRPERWAHADAWAGRMRGWAQEARGVAFFEETYAASQLWKADWERWQGDVLCPRADAIIREIEPL